jgi:hypothetical protein
VSAAFWYLVAECSGVQDPCPHPPPPLPSRFPARLVSSYCGVHMMFAPCTFVQRDYCMHMGGGRG